MASASKRFNFVTGRTAVTKDCASKGTQAGQAIVVHSNFTNSEGAPGVVLMLVDSLEKAKQIGALLRLFLWYCMYVLSRP